MTNGLGADSVLECVGTQESMMQAIRSTRPGGYVSYVGVPHGVELDGEELFFAHVHLHGGPAPVRRYLPELIDLVLNGKIDPGKVFDLTLPLDQVAEGYRAMDERRAIKTTFVGAAGPSKKQKGDEANADHQRNQQGGSSFKQIRPRDPF
jgi:threonine dehydrogenase-like Zn-dependent dehydrogenase